MWIYLYTIQNEMLLSPIIVQGVLVFLISILFIYKAKQEENKNLKTGIYVIVILADCFMVVFLWITYIASNQDNDKTAKRYEENDYQIIEGYIVNYKEDCDKIINQSDDEYFEIAGVAFEYRDLINTAGYHTIRKNGGVIKGNGQYLRICYVNTKLNSETESRNVILRIDEFVQ